MVLFAIGIMIGGFLGFCIMGIFASKRKDDDEEEAYRRVRAEWLKTTEE